ncbi:MAG: AMP-binding protein [Rhodobacteraceae bacterium]|nr:AMP-binding protein [Paracoccaceae bacterium]
MSDLAAIFEATARRMGGKPALVAPEGTISFAGLDARAAGFAGRLAARGIGPGTRVLVAAPVGIALYVMLAGIWRRGAVAVFPEPAMGLRGLLHALRSARPAAFAAAGGYRWLKALPPVWPLPLLGPGPETDGPARLPLPPDHPALISFTSGSTGAPKAIQRSHAFLLAQHRAVLGLLGEDPTPRDLVAFPVFALVNLAAGRTTILPDWRQDRQDRVTGRALSAWIETTRADRLLLPPALVEALARHGLPAGVRHVFTGGGPVFPDVLDRLVRPGLAVSCVYGSTEAEPVAHLEAGEITEADRAAMRAGAGLLAGRPVPQIRVRIAGGEIQVAGDHVNRGYLDPARDAETKVAEGETVWHRTGDAGRLDAEGRLWLLGRVSAVVRRGGHELHPFAVETAARFWPGVARAALAEAGGRAILAIEGDPAHLADWQARGTALGLDAVRLMTIPLDRRHRSKVDYPALRRRLGG